MKGPAALGLSRRAESGGTGSVAGWSNPHRTGGETETPSRREPHVKLATQPEMSVWKCAEHSGTVVGKRSGFSQVQSRIKPTRHLHETVEAGTT